MQLVNLYTLKRSLTNGSNKIHLANYIVRCGEVTVFQIVKYIKDLIFMRTYDIEILVYSTEGKFRKCFREYEFLREDDFQHEFIVIKKVDEIINESTIIEITLHPIHIYSKGNNLLLEITHCFSLSIIFGEILQKLKLPVESFRLVDGWGNFVSTDLDLLASLRPQNHHHRYITLYVIMLETSNKLVKSIGTRKRIPHLPVVKIINKFNEELFHFPLDSNDLQIDQLVSQKIMVPSDLIIFFHYGKALGPGRLKKCVLESFKNDTKDQACLRLQLVLKKSKANLNEIISKYNLTELKGLKFEWCNGEEALEMDAKDIRCSGSIPQIIYRLDKQIVKKLGCEYDYAKDFKFYDSISFRNVVIDCFDVFSSGGDLQEIATVIMSVGTAHSFSVRNGVKNHFICLQSVLLRYPNGEELVELDEKLPKTVLTVKKYIEKTRKIPTYLQAVSFKNQELRDEEYLCLVCRKSQVDKATLTLDLVIKMDTFPKRFKLSNPTDVTGIPESLDLLGTSTVSHLKHTLEALTDIQAERFEVFAEYDEQPDDKFMYELQDKYLVVKPTLIIRLFRKKSENEFEQIKYAINSKHEKITNIIVYAYLNGEHKKYDLVEKQNFTRDTYLTDVLRMNKGTIDLISKHKSCTLL